ncbi:sugar phosphate isomerase/epimerase [Rhodopseudomonas sp. WA056]|uniref:sugar phosphate isomerase/epimerase family protein n=1 Tax=Rhodopseudomonas sp. WA056 TaxID=2269367 RepID=UPI0013DFADD1|nr:sugar phosphate isomerase/epimerase [Rhodopseudomonas sp. WA056]NEW86973.1 sugar phosphate isomerase/epimerase [Rhodopseudomonas sp. WA056]
MKLSVCTITFRHHLLSFDEIADWARGSGFHGVELWAAHARGLLRTHPQYGAGWLAGYGLSVPMLSDYLPTDGDAAEIRRRTVGLCRLAEHWSARKIRTFAGNIPSRNMSRSERRSLAHRLRDIAAVVHDHGIRLLVETHPNTLADGLEPTLCMLADADHPGLGINFDALHVWEANDDPIQARCALAEFIGHYHLKNVRARSELGVFAPENVYSAAGTREGMVPLFDGAMDYDNFLSAMAAESEAEASLEWFGNNCFETLVHDRIAVLAHLGSTMRGPGSPEARRSRSTTTGVANSAPGLA